MTMPTLPRNDFDTVTQSGSDEIWNNIGSLDYPESGPADVQIPYTGSQLSNTLWFEVVHNASTIPNGAKCDNLSFRFSARKTGLVSSGVDLDVLMGTDDGGLEATYAITDDETFMTFTRSGDKDYWNLGSWTEREVIERIKSGALRWYLRMRVNNAILLERGEVQDVSLEVQYTEVEGKRGAVLIPLSQK